MDSQKRGPSSPTPVVQPQPKRRVLTRRKDAHAATAAPVVRQPSPEPEVHVEEEQEPVVHRPVNRMHGDLVGDGEDELLAGMDTQPIGREREDRYDSDSEQSDVGETYQGPDNFITDGTYGDDAAEEIAACFPGEEEFEDLFKPLVTEDAAKAQREVMEDALAAGQAHRVPHDRGERTGPVANLMAELHKLGIDDIDGQRALEWLYRREFGQDEIGSETLRRVEVELGIAAKKPWEEDGIVVQDTQGWGQRSLDVDEGGHTGAHTGAQTGALTGALPETRERERISDIKALLTNVISSVIAGQ
ncbi:hypothetical protein KIPB_009704, partial [Kipferlia bialata]|eukprot:g9704.t1